EADALHVLVGGDVRDPADRVPGRLDGDHEQDRSAVKGLGYATIPRALADFSQHLQDALHDVGASR
ncbi:hypothetical protein, partial [Streptomyces mirabilis]|uniref:hypothetical protein n=1 Tax=Streptomyces mirabilis TaxID=68239 RepID=UPI0033D7C36B